MTLDSVSTGANIAETMGLKTRVGNGKLLGPRVILFNWNILITESLSEPTDRFKYISDCQFFFQFCLFS